MFTAVVNAVLLIGIAAFILYEAVRRLGDAPAIPGVPLTAVALGGLATNTAVALLLRSQSTRSLAVKGAYTEVVADTVGSLGVLVAGVVTLTTGWPTPTSWSPSSSRCGCCRERCHWRRARCASCPNRRHATSTSTNCARRYTPSTV
ncbi:cation efflux family protein [Mycobacterium xenopi 3993]|nr:cation efflux family protein [Mycobacterium xenopi 3993]